MIDDILSSRRNNLLELVEASLEDCEPHSRAFTEYILGQDFLGIRIATIQFTREEILYGGFPQVACVGFQLNSTHNGSDEELVNSFISGVKRLRNRTRSAIEESFASDDIALLGIALGVASVSEILEDEEIKSWLLQIINRPKKVDNWTSRLRDLAGDLLDQKGRLYALPQFGVTSIGALEIVMRHHWPKQFPQTSTIDLAEFRILLGNLIKESHPHTGDVEQAAIRLKALDLLLEGFVETLLPRTDVGSLALDAIRNIKETLDSKAEKEVNRVLWFMLIDYFGVIVGIGLLILRLGWDVMEPWTYFISLVGALIIYGYFIISTKEYSPTNIKEQLVLLKKAKLYKNIGLDLKQAERLVR